MKPQKQVWENIAYDWSRFKNNPIKRVVDFLMEKEGNIVDLGSGSGRHLLKIKKSKIYLVDFSETMIKLAKKKAEKEKINAEFFVADMANLPFSDNFFDAGIMISSLHCIPSNASRENAVKELYRVLKPNGEVIVSVFNKNSEQFKNCGKEKFIRWLDKEIRYYYLFDENEIYELFSNNKFEIIKKWVPKKSIEFIAKKPQ